MPAITTAGLLNLRQYFESGTTRDYSFRRSQLLKLRGALQASEAAIYAALEKDLGKCREESWASELGLVLSEINLALSQLRGWMRPRAVGTDLVNLPSSSRIYRDPLGVVLIISPWNYPLQLLLIPLVGAISGGNCAVLKPSELAPATAAILEELIQKTFDPAYIRLLQGEGATLVPELMDQFRFDHIFYTGSIPVGKLIYQQAARDLVPVTLELGGKSPAVVEADADLAAAARRIILGKFINAGQTCVAPDYVLVHQDVKEALVEKMKECLARFYGPDPEQSPDYGRIINAKRFDTLSAYLASGHILAGGKGNREKLYLAPTLMDQVGWESPVMQAEIFGPVLPIHSYSDRQEAFEKVQQHPNPLAFYLFTASGETEKFWVSRLAFGGGCVNNAVWYFTNHHLPFGGVGSSGMGAYHGKFTFDNFTRLKPVMKTPTWFDPAIKYPPFKGKLRLFKWFIR